MITIESVAKTYGSSTAVDHVSFRARPGRVTGFLGPNGAGKSTTMRILVGLTRATSGTAPSPGTPTQTFPTPGARSGCIDLLKVEAHQNALRVPLLSPANVQ